MNNVKESLEEIILYRALSNYTNLHEQRYNDLQVKLEELKNKLRSIEYTWKEGRFDSVYHCIVCGKIKPNDHSADCWLNKAINHD